MELTKISGIIVFLVDFDRLPTDCQTLGGVGAVFAVALGCVYKNVHLVLLARGRPIEIGHVRKTDD